MTTATEVERKFEVPVDYAVPDLSAVPAVARVDDPEEHGLDATYYDTQGLALIRHRVTLRRRTGGHDEGWHLKLPGGNDARTEVHEPLGADEGIPEAIARRVADLAGGERLGPVVRIRTRRRERPLRGADGGVLALVADDDVTSETLAGPPVVQRWRELEVELVDGTREVLDEVGDVLCAAGARPAGTASKLAHALGDRYPSNGPLGDYLTRQRDAVRENEAGVRDGDPEAVHDTRVAVRRLRSTLRTFRPVLDRARTEPVRAELRWLAGLLGGVRDGDVLNERLAEAIAAEPAELMVGPVAARIRERLTAGTEQARRALTEAMDGERYAALMADVDAVSAPVPVPHERLRALARKALRRADRLLAVADGAAAGDRDVALHEARKAYKRARYAVEVLAPAAGGAARRLTKRLTALQDVLGAHQDAVVAEGLLRDYGMRAYLQGENAFSYGLLHARQRAAGERRLAGVRRARRRAGKRRVRDWLG
jgi:CHAD domain-containing protein